MPINKEIETACLNTVIGAGFNPVQITGMVNVLVKPGTPVHSRHVLGAMDRLRRYGWEFISTAELERRLKGGG